MVASAALPNVTERVCRRAGCPAGSQPSRAGAPSANWPIRHTHPRVPKHVLTSQYVMYGTPTVGRTRPSTSRPEHDHRGRSAPRRSTLGSADASATCHQQRLNENLNTVVKKPDPHFGAASPHPVRRPHLRVPKYRLTSHDGVSGPHRPRISSLLSSLFVDSARALSY